MLAWILSLALAGVTLTLLMLSRRLNALRRQVAQLTGECEALNARQSDQGQDIHGLSAAGFQQDRRILEQETRLRDLLERIESLHSDNSVNQPYHAAIERARRGAEADELVAEFGLSPSEADLLARLHGGARNAR